MRVVRFLDVLQVAALATAQDALVELDYGSFQGAYDSTYNLSNWIKIPFAAPPTGVNRFRAPQPPLHITNGTYDTNQSWGRCPSWQKMEPKTVST